MHKDRAEKNDPEGSEHRLGATIKTHADEDTEGTEEPETDPKNPIEETERALRNILIFFTCCWLWIGKRHDQIVALGTLGILFATSIYAAFSFLQWEANQKAANAAKSAADTARDTLIVSERPWIKVEEMVATSPLTFLANGRANVNLSFHLRNVGNSVATRIYLRPQLMANTFDNTLWERPFARQKDWCDYVRKETPNPDALKTLFPTDDAWEPMGLQLTKEEIDSSSATFPLKELRGKLINPMVYGCVNYEFPFSKDVHQTRFMFSISRMIPNSPTSRAFQATNPISVGGDVPEAELIIEKYFFGGTFAD
jgi:hypothetical protein